MVDIQNTTQKIEEFCSMNNYGKYGCLSTPFGMTAEEFIEHCECCMSCRHSKAYKEAIKKIKGKNNDRTT